MASNYYKTSDIKIYKDSQDSYTCEHKYQGTLIDSSWYPSRNEARREAVKILMERKEDNK